MMMQQTHNKWHDPVKHAENRERFEKEMAYRATKYVGIHLANC